LVPWLQKHDENLGWASFADQEHFPTDILEMCEAMSPVMEARGRKFKIDNDLQLGLNWGRQGKGNPQGLREVRINFEAIAQTVQELEEMV